MASGKLDGYLNGFIDLVFEHAGRYYLLDWKSNHLGTTPASYGQEALAAAMAQHGYHLQYLLYCVALDRHLALRLRGYDGQRTSAACCTSSCAAFAPGGRPTDSQRACYFHRPHDDAIEALSALLRHEQEVSA